jgi:hypothetical protein
MSKPTYAERVQAEKLPVVDGVQYRAVQVKIIDSDCSGCAARLSLCKNTTLCNALPSCSKESRLDGINVVFVACGKAVGK